MAPASSQLQELQGDVDIVLRPTSERMAASNPLAAVLRRQMADAALAWARTQTYDRVVQDLRAAEQLAVCQSAWKRGSSASSVQVVAVAGA